MNGHAAGWRETQPKEIIIKHTIQGDQIFKFRIFITGNSPNSVLAVESLQKLCRDRLPMQHEIEIVDVLLEPQRALDDGVLLTPLIIKLAPGKVQKILGNLVRPDLILIAMDLSS